MSDLRFSITFTPDCVALEIVRPTIDGGDVVCTECAEVTS